MFLQTTCQKNVFKLGVSQIFNRPTQSCLTFSLTIFLFLICMTFYAFYQIQFYILANVLVFIKLFYILANVLVLIKLFIYSLTYFWRATGTFHRKKVVIEVLASKPPSCQTAQSILRAMQPANSTGKKTQKYQ